MKCVAVAVTSEFDDVLASQVKVSRASALDCFAMRPRLKVWIETDDGRVALSEWRVVLLQAVAEHGSLVAAARALGVPHRTAWQRVREMETVLGVRLVETTSGGSGGGRSRLSPAAEDFVRRYEALRAGLDDLVGERFQNSFRQLSS
jgi:molybdate transport system regulatory protein